MRSLPMKSAKRRGSFLCRRAPSAVWRFPHTGTSLPHGLSYRVTCELGTPHGKAVGMFLPGFLRCYGDQEEAMRVLTLLGFGSHQSFEAYIYSLIGEEKISHELWERTMNDLLSNPRSSKTIRFRWIGKSSMD